MRRTCKKMNLKGFAQLSCSQSHLWREKASLGLSALSGWLTSASLLKPNSLCEGTVKLKLFYTGTTDLVWAVWRDSHYLLRHKKPGAFICIATGSAKAFGPKALLFSWKESCVVMTRTIPQYEGRSFWRGSLKRVFASRVWTNSWLTFGM